MCPPGGLCPLTLTLSHQGREEGARGGGDKPRHAVILSAVRPVILTAAEVVRGQESPSPQSSPVEGEEMRREVGTKPRHAVMLSAVRPVILSATEVVRGQESPSP